MDGQTILILAPLAWLAWSAFAATFWPWVPCVMPRCENGKVRRPGKRKAFRRCWWCSGSGSRMRWARRAYERARRSRVARRR